MAFFGGFLKRHERPASAPRSEPPASTSTQLPSGLRPVATVSDAERRSLERSGEADAFRLDLFEGLWADPFRTIHIQRGSISVIGSVYCPDVDDIEVDNVNFSSCGSRLSFTVRYPIAALDGVEEQERQHSLAEAGFHLLRAATAKVALTANALGYSETKWNLRLVAADLPAEGDPAAWARPRGSAHVLVLYGSAQNAHGDVSEERLFKVEGAQARFTAARFTSNSVQLTDTDGDVVMYAAPGPSDEDQRVCMLVNGEPLGRTSFLKWDIGRHELYDSEGGVSVFGIEDVETFPALHKLIVGKAPGTEWQQCVRFVDAENHTVEFLKRGIGFDATSADRSAHWIRTTNSPSTIQLLMDGHLVDSHVTRVEWNPRTQTISTDSGHHFDVQMAANAAAKLSDHLDQLLESSITFVQGQSISSTVTHSMHRARMNPGIHQAEVNAHRDREFQRRRQEAYLKASRPMGGGSRYSSSRPRQSNARMLMPSSGRRDFDQFQFDPANFDGADPQTALQLQRVLAATFIETLVKMLQREEQLRLSSSVQLLLNEHQENAEYVYHALQRQVALEHGFKDLEMGVQAMRSACSLFPDEPRLRTTSLYVRHNRSRDGTLAVGQEVPDVPLYSLPCGSSTELVAAPLSAHVQQLVAAAE